MENIEHQLIQTIAEKIGYNYSEELHTDTEILEEINNDLDFTMTGMDIAKELQIMLNKFKNKITKGMNKDERDAYDLGVENSIEFLEQILENEAFIFDQGTEVPTENDMGTIIEVMRNMQEDI